MNDKKLEGVAKDIAKAVNDGRLEEAIKILRRLTSDAIIKASDVVPLATKAVVTTEPQQ